MHYFPLFDLQQVILLVFLGVTVLLLLYIAFSGRPLFPARGNKERKEEYPEGIQADHRPVPLILIFIYGAYFCWAVGYVVSVGIRGVPF
jgi:hypothetical protein